jgi:hypothetical protein
MPHRRTLVVCAALALASEAGAQRQPETPRQRAGAGRVAVQVLGGAAASAVAGIAAWKLLDDPEGSDRRVKGDAGYTPNANTAYAVASLAAGAAASYWIGRGDGSRGSWLATAVGVAVPTIPMLLMRHEPYLPVLGVVIGAPLQGIGGAVGYQATRRR